MTTPEVPCPGKRAPRPVELSVVMPVYNEMEHLERVLLDWHEALTDLEVPFEMIVVNDGSMDGSGRILDRLRREHPEFRVVHQLNLGRDRAARRGFEAARGRHVLQVDTSGRYEPGDFLRLWELRESPLVLGYRTHRLDPGLRRGLSAVLRAWCQLLFGCPFKDPHLSFRLYDAAVLSRYLPRVPADFESVNLALTLLMYRDMPGALREVPVPFRFRRGGSHRTRLWHVSGSALSLCGQVAGLWLRQVMPRVLRPFTERSAAAAN